MRYIRPALIAALAATLGLPLSPAPRALAQPAQPQPPQQQPKSEDLKIEQEWSGLIHFGVAQPGDRTCKPYLLVIRDQKAYDAFIGQIPAKEVSKTNPAPDSKDPLLKKPEIDFKKHMLLVAVRGENMYCAVKVQRVASVDGKLKAFVEHPKMPEHAHMLAYPYGVGTYHAVLVAAREGDVAQELATLGTAIIVTPVAVEKSYSGFVSYGEAEDAPKSEFLVIRDQAAYEAFIGRIPERQISMTANPPKSNDPLLQKPALDFAKQMLVVVIRREHIYAKVSVAGVEKHGAGKWLVKAAFEAVSKDDAMMQYPLGVGTYAAAVVAKFDGEVEREITLKQAPGK